MESRKKNCVKHGVPLVGMAHAVVPKTGRLKETRPIGLVKGFFHYIDVSTQLAYPWEAIAVGADAEMEES